MEPEAEANEAGEVGGRMEEMVPWSQWVGLIKPHDPSDAGKQVEGGPQKFEQIKAQIRSRVEPPFHILKNIFKYQQVRDRGLAKNTAQLHTRFALANLILARRSLAQSVY